MKQVTIVNLNIPGYSKERKFFLSRPTLDECDIVIFQTFDSYSGVTGEYRGKDSLDHNSSNSVREETKYWRDELTAFVESGKNVFIVVKELYQFYIKTGEHAYSGTGRNARRTEYVDEFDNYRFINLSGLQFINAHGSHFKMANSMFAAYPRMFSSVSNFQCYIKHSSITPFLLTKNGREIVSGILPTGKGNFIFLPNIDFEDLVEIKNKKEVWTQDALRLGKMFFNFIIELDDKILTNQEKSLRPDWVHNDGYNLKIEAALKTKIYNNNQKIEKLSKANTEFSEKIEEETRIKDLLYETGKPLEKAVLTALYILGYSAENFDNGTLELDAVIVSPESDRFIGECEGKDSKDIDVSKFRQLTDSLSEDFERDDVSEKALGLIFGNAQRLVDVNDRKLDFTEKCKSGAKRENIGLIRTSDLFFAVRYLMQNPDEIYKKQCRLAIREQLGSIIVFPDIPTNK
ncbi:hypothetical protein [Dyadobacter chenhuakuii]|uniref:Restriction endonuclease n=1 Tax=Dyadobacter chenhuakuii TaxID=2909339 RepID=A0ABY4XFF6_9BACT|nr:hypothetical protein [Dyadobacter chenhuakuii]MCF2496598.1 hypothetical protein [Dyadobacter chenhuakuii]USJ29142.1 hypothetical protein NFI80_14790 [Dyadobacter chenhuakuii]